MKLKNELPEMIERFSKFKDIVLEHAKKVKLSGEYKDFETRVTWDCVRAAYKSGEVCDLYKKYDCHDSHIDTIARIALRSILDIKTV